MKIIVQSLVLTFLSLATFLNAQQSLESVQDNMRVSYISSPRQAASREAFKDGYYYYNNMAYEAAISFFRDALVQNPHNDLAYYWLGRAYVMAGYNDMAINTWEALQKNSSYPDLFIQQELDKLYAQGFKSSDTRNITSKSHYVFLRMMNTLANPSSMALDNNNNLYISDLNKGRINIYNANLKKIFVIQQGLKKPIHIFFKENLMYVSDFGTDSIRVYDIENHFKFLYQFGGFGIQTGNFAGPIGMCAYEDKLYIVDQGNNRVQIFQSTPKPYFIGQFGKRGSGLGEFLVPKSIVVYHKELWVTDMMNHRIQIFDLEGNYISQIRQDEIDSPVQLFAHQDNLYLVDQNKGCFIFDPDTQHFVLIQNPTQNLQQISAVAMDNNGILFMADISNPTIIAYAKDTEKLSSLNVSTLFVTTTAYPRIIMKLRIQDSEGKDIYGLDNHSIQVLQDGYKMVSTLQPVVPVNNQIATTIIIHNSKTMMEHKNEVTNYLDALIDSKKPDDRIRIITYNNQKKIEEDFTTKILNLKNAVQHIQWIGGSNSVSGPDILDQVLYDALDANEFNDSHGSLLLLDDNSDTPFTKYSEEVIASHAQRIGVPIYVLTLDSKNNQSSKYKSLQFISSKSGGKLLLYNKSNQIFDLMDLMRKNSPLFYTLTYTNSDTADFLSGYWAKVVLRLEYRALYGVDHIGYLVNQNHGH